MLQAHNPPEIAEARQRLVKNTIVSNFSGSVSSALESGCLKAAQQLFKEMAMHLTSAGLLLLLTGATMTLFADFDPVPAHAQTPMVHMQAAANQH
ncbi:hypothetical protein DYI23_03015 [Roseibium polysiphoniae]|uniref:Uncharacterized protein n=1 Tax=Roseibium polysiphoniae TaxID=2571221 RepID=A0A944GS97_9HYPH|nr:hypothetical protein [Roseibium polysiphoniae]